MKLKFLFILFLATGLFLSFRIANAQVEKTLSPELENCLKEKMGESLFNQIKSGAKQPSSEEAKKGEVCFQKYGKELQNRESGDKQRDMNFEATTDACLQKKLGSGYKDKLKQAKSREEGERIMGQAKECFSGGEREKVPPEVKQCIIKNAGEAEANKMFSGERPSSDSAVYKKLEGAGCFKSFKHGSGKMADVPEDKRQCIEGVMGNMTEEPTEEQKKLVGEKCFGGGGPDGQGRSQLPAAVESCLKEKMGNSFMEKSKESFTEEERNSAGECFRQNNFQPEGASNSRRPEMSESTKQCIEKIIGQPLNGPINVGDSAKNQINTECFGGKADEMTGEGGAAGKTRQEVDSCASRITGGAPGPYSAEIQARLNKECYSEQQTAAGDNPRANPDKQACIDRIAGDTSVQMTYEEKQAKINAECFAAERYGQPKDEAYDSGASQQGAPGTRPGGCADDACVQQYCQANPGACGPRP